MKLDSCRQQNESSVFTPTAVGNKKNHQKPCFLPSTTKKTIEFQLDSRREQKNRQFSPRQPSN